MKNEYFEIVGGTKLFGEITNQTSKNATLPIMSASLLCDEKVKILETPNITDVNNMIKLLNKIGVKKISLTRNHESTLAKACDVSLAYKYKREADELGLAPTVSALLTLAVGDALAVTLSSLMKFTPEDFHLYHPGGALGKMLEKKD